MEIPDDALKTVVFLYIEKTVNGKIEHIPKGTGFFISLASVDGAHFVYLVTAKHVIEKTAGMNLTVRVNGKEGGSIHVSVQGGFGWIYHPTDKNVDVAIIPFAFPIDMDIRPIPIESFLKPENVENGDVQIGNEIFITGLFAHHHGKFANTPIVRVGNIAMLPTKDEKIAIGWHGGVEIDAYLIEARSIGGLSGSPVFFPESQYKFIETKEGDEKGAKRLAMRNSRAVYLGGLIHGHWKTDSSKIDDAESLEEEKNVNMGIAIVIPAQKILETVMSPALQEIRKSLEESILKEKGSVAKAD